MLAAAAAVLAGLPLSAGALIAARPFARAAVRYRILAAAFGLAALVGPLALAAAALRPAAAGSAAASPASGAADLLGAPAAAVAAAVGLALLLELVFDVRKLRRVKRCAVPLGTVAVRGARIGTSRTVSTPTAIGYLHPAVVLPEGFRARVDEREWDAVVAHECAHLARRDDWAKAVQSAVQRACWWLPGLWVLGRALDLERELAADERAAGETGPRRYAACLLRLATDRGSELAPAFGGRRSHVAIRVERLLRPVADGGPLLRAVALGAFTGAAFAVLAAAVLAVPGTAPRAVPSTAALRPADAIIAHAAVRHAAPRIAAHTRRSPGTPPHRSPSTLAANVDLPAGDTTVQAGPNPVPAATTAQAGSNPAPSGPTAAQTGSNPTPSGPTAAQTGSNPTPSGPAAARAAADAGPATSGATPTSPRAPSTGAVSAPRQVALARTPAARFAGTPARAVATEPGRAEAQAAVPASAPAQVIARIESSLRRAESSARGATASVGRPAPVRAQAEDVAFVTPRAHCRTCFGPLRSADDAAAAAQAPAFAPPAGLPGAGAAALAPDDPTAGPGSLDSAMIWFRYPTRSRQQ